MVSESGYHSPLYYSPVGVSRSKKAKTARGLHRTDVTLNEKRDNTAFPRHQAKTHIAFLPYPAPLRR